MRAKWLWAAAAVVAALVLLPGAVSARATLQGDVCVVEADQVIAGNLFALCGTLVINGTVAGDVIGAAVYAEARGDIQGDIYLAAGQLDVYGSVGDDVVFMGAALRLHPGAALASATSSVISLGLSTEVRAGVVVPQSITALNYQLIINGAVNGGVSFWGSALVIGGAVAGDVDAVVGDPSAGDGSQLQTLLLPFRVEVEMVSPGLVVTESGSVGGALRYSGPVEGRIAGTLAQEPEFTLTSTRPDLTQIALGEPSTFDALRGFLGNILAEFVTLALVGVLGLLLAPRAMLSPAAHLRSRPLVSLGMGVLAFLMSFGVLFLLLALGLLLFGLGLLLGLTNLSIIALLALGLFVVGGGSGFYFVALYVSRVVVCLAAGRGILRALTREDGGQRTVYLGLLASTAALALLVWLPLVGALANGISLALGLGAIILMLAPARGARHAAAARGLPARSADARQMPPPIYDAPAAGPGMSDLPEGFDWWSSEQKKP